MAKKSAIDLAIDAYLNKKRITPSKLKVEIKNKGASHKIFHDPQLRTQDKRKLMKEHAISYQELKAAREKRKVADIEKQAANAKREGSEQVAQLASGFGPEGMAVGAGVKLARSFGDAHPVLSKITGLSRLNKTVDKISGADTKQASTKQKIRILMQKGRKPTMVIAAIIVIILILSAGFLFSGDSGAKFVGNAGRKFIKYFAEEEYWQTLNKVGSLFAKTIDKIKGQFDRQAEIAITGDVFAGKVDEYANKKLGLNLEVDDQKTTSSERQPLIKTDGKVEYAFITGGISGRGLDSDICQTAGVKCASDQIELSCFTNRNEQGTMVPAILDFKYIENQFIGTSCNFNNLEVGNDKSRTIFMQAKFDFISASSIEKPMVSVTKFDELFKTGYQFEKSTARYTPGPVSIKILDTFVKKDVLIATQEMPVRFGVEFENVGEGTIDHFKQISLMLPEGVKIRACNPPMDGTNPAVLNYEKTQSYLKFTKNRNMEPGNRMKITCDLLITPEALYVADEITRDFFQVLAEYEYRIQKGVKFEIQEFEKIVVIKNDDIQLCTVDTCECIITVAGKEKSTKLLENGENCGETHKQIAIDCKEKTEENCESTKNQCKWIDGRYGCRIKTFEVA